MNKLFPPILISALCGMLLLAASPLTFADTSVDDARKLLQKSLTVYELDQEIARLDKQEADIAAQIAKSNDDITAKNTQVAATRQHAGKILRAYYMGDRIQVWMLVFSAKSFAQALDMYEYLDMIVQYDRKALTTYQTAYRGLLAAKDLLETEQSGLEEVKGEFIRQRDRALALQKEIDDQLAKMPDAPFMKNQMADLTIAWQEKGLPLFKTYFQALNKAIQSLPELLTGNGGNSKSNFLNGMSFQITDTDLNRFFRTKNSLFNNLTIRFADGSFIAEGKEKEVDISIKGNYVIENTPHNKLQFHVQELTFNGFILPDTTDRSLEQEFDLGFSPGEIVPFVEATDVQIADGKLTVKLKLHLKQ